MFLLKILWPFLKEMILGDKTLKEAVKTNKGRVFVLAVICTSLVLNCFFIPKTFRISYEYVELKRKYEILTKTYLLSEEFEKPAKDHPSPLEPAEQTDEEYRKTKELFERMKREERR